MDSKLAVITVNYENYKVTEGFLSSLSANPSDKYKVFISDLSLNRKTIKHPNSVVVQGENRGYAYGINVGIRNAVAAGFANFAVINNDTLVRHDFIDNCLSALNDNPATIIGGKIYYAAGFEYHKKSYPSDKLGQVIWYAGGVTDWKNAITKHRGVDEIDNGQFSQMEKTDFVTGCLMLFDRKVLDRVGFWDESYFLYYEDADYCERAKKLGIKLVYDPQIVIWHKNAQSTSGSGSDLHQKYQKINRLKFGLRYAPLRTKLHLLKNYLFRS